MTQLQALGGLKLESTSFTRPKPLLLLAYLALEGTQQRKHLAELFWQDGNRMKSLSMALTLLRQGAGEVFEADKKQVKTTLPSDVRALLEALDKSDWKKVDELYTGAFLEGVVLEDWSSELEEWVYQTREYLAERVQYALLELAEDAAKKQDFEITATLAERAYKLPGLGGTEIANLKRLYTLLCAGNSLLAPEVLKEAQSYGVTLQLTTEEARAIFKHEMKVTNALSMRGTSFVGRDVELTELATLLNKPNVSLLTLLGTAGVGKTRLALQLAHEQQKLETFKDGVYFVALESLTDASLIPTTLLSHLGLNQQGKIEPLQQLTDFFADKQILLVLDNFEHVTAGAMILSLLLSNCPNLKILVTSRETLKLEEENIFALEGLPIPQTFSDDAKLSDAVQLFKERARQVKLQFDLNGQLPDVIRICQLVEGLPLGIELAASWVRMMSCSEIANEIERGLELLTSHATNIPERHRSLKATFEYSWKLLTQKEQEVLRKLSVFHGGFRREAASEVAGTTIPALASLVDKSLLRVFEGRYDFHPLLQQYAFEKLAASGEEMNDVEGKHADFFVALAASIENERQGRQQQQWLTRLEQEHDNFRVVLAWVLEHTHQNTKGLELASRLERFWYLRGYFSEGRAWLDALLEQATNKKSLAYLKGLHASGWLAFEQGEYRVTQRLLDACIKLGEELEAKNISAKNIVAGSLRGLGLMAQERGDYVVARNFQEQSLVLGRTMEDSWGISASLNNLGLIAYGQADYPSAQMFHEESLVIRRKLGDDSVIAASLNNLGLVALAQGDTASAARYLEENLAIRKALGDRRGLAMAYNNLGLLEEERGDYEKANLLFKESLKIVNDIGHKWGATYALGSLAHVAASQGEFGRAAVLWGALEKLREMLGTPLPPNEKILYEQKVMPAKTHLGDEAFTRAWSQGTSLGLEQAIRFALEHSTMTLEMTKTTVLETV